MLKVMPLTLKQANDLVASLHRHHKPAQGHRFSIGCKDETGIHGAAICGRPVARGCDPYLTLEVVRLVTDGTFNACSILYGAAARAAKAMGFEHIQTYLLEEESATSVKASGWQFEAWTAGGDWNHSKANAGTRRTDQPMGRKQRWGRDL
jgi:hypothetical protein